MQIHNCQQGTEEWLKIRLGKFTCSTAQPIAAKGKGLETLVFEKVAEILTGKLPPIYKNADMERGNELEPEARIAYEFESENVVEQVGFVELNEFVGGSPDGIIGDDGLVEIKCPNNTVFARYLYDHKVDTGYFWQMQMQMYVTDRKWCDYVVFNENFPTTTKITRIERDDKSIEKLKVGLEQGIELLNKILSEVKNGK